MAKLVINTELNTKKFDAQILATETKLNELKAGYEEFSTEKGFNAQSIQAVEFRKEIEKTTNALMRLKEQQSKLNKITATNIQYNASPKLASGLTLTGRSLGGYAKGIESENFDYVAKNVEDLKNAFPDLGQAGEEAGEKSGRGFERGLRSIKRFGLALLGIRGAFTVISRATSSYLSEHEETANKINSIWVALGNALGPIIEMIADAVLHLIGYLNVFLQALGFDVDLTKNMNKSTKAIQGTTGAMKELNRQVASFDEMNVAQKDTSGGGIGGGTGGTSGFQMPELNEGIVKILENVAGVLKENWKWLLAIAGIFKGAQWIGKLTGTGGLISGLKTLGTIGIVVAGVDLVYNALTGRDLIQDLKQIMNDLKELGKINDDNTEFIASVDQATKDMIKTHEKEILATKKGSKEAERWINDLYQIIEYKATENKQMQDTIDGWWGVEKIIHVADRTYQNYTNRIGENNDVIFEAMIMLAKMRAENKLTDEQFQKFTKVIEASGGRVLDYTTEINNLNRASNEGENTNKLYADTLHAINSELYEGTDAGTWFGKGMETNVNKPIKDATTNTKNLKGSLVGLGSTIVSPTVKVKDNIDEVKNKLKNLAVAMTIGTSLNISTIKNAFGLAKGGIVNNPGRGVPISSVITGESTNGAEGVIPMNNDEVMDMLGQKIARHIEINLTNNTMLDNKVIAREQVKLKSNVDFLTNGRGV